MATIPVPADRARLLGLLRSSLIVGAVYDLIFAALMVLAPEIPARLLHLPMPGEAFYLWLMAIFLTMLSAFYLLAAYDPTSYRGNIAVAIGGRTAGGLALLLAAVDSGLAGLYPLAAADLFFACVHGVLWWPFRR